MNKKMIGLLVVAAIGLSACSSTGGARNGYAQGHALGNSAGTSDKQNTTTSNTTNTTTSVDETTQTTASRSLGTVYGSVSPEHKDRSTYFATTDTQWQLNTIDEVEIDGRRIALIPEGKSPTNGIYESPSTGEKIYTGTSTAPFAQESTKSWRKIAADLKHVRHGQIYDEFEKHHVVVTGDLTPESKMPTANEEVVYKGKALHTKDSYTAARDGTRPITADAEFHVNFHQHTLAGTIKPESGAAAENQFTPLSLKATIKGNAFEGSDSARIPENYNELTMDNGKEHVFTPAYVTGYFYGPNGEEMAGGYYKITGENEVVLPDGTIIHPRNTTHGTFGASKQ